MPHMLRAFLCWHYVDLCECRTLNLATGLLRKLRLASHPPFFISPQPGNNSSSAKYSIYLHLYLTFSPFLSTSLTNTLVCFSANAHKVSSPVIFLTYFVHVQSWQLKLRSSPGILHCPPHTQDSFLKAYINLEVTLDESFHHEKQVSKVG